MITTNKFARIISDIFIPPTFTLIGFTYISLTYFHTVADRLIIILNAITFGVFLPIFFFIQFRKKRIVSDNDAIIKEQRALPYLASIGVSSIGAISIYFSQGNNIALYFWLAITFNSIGLYFINKFWKISAHAIGGATVVGLLYFLESSLFPYFLILIIIVGLSRYILRVHTPAQIIAGMLYGIIVSVAQLNFYYGVL